MPFKNAILRYHYTFIQGTDTATHLKTTRLPHLLLHKIAAILEDDISNQFSLTKLIESIIWINDDPIHWRIYAALGGDELERRLDEITWFLELFKCTPNVDQTKQNFLCTVLKPITCWNIHSYGLKC